MKKILAVLVLSIITLAGCGSSGTGELSGEITVGVFGTPTEIKTYEDQGAKFTEETGVDVTFKQYTDFTTEIQTELIGGTAPDVFYVDAYIFPFLAAQGVLEPVDESLYDMDQYNDNLLNSFMYEGKLYALPKDYSTLAIYYNKEYVSEEDIPENYEDLGAYLKELKTTLPDGMVPMTYNVDLSRQMYLAQISGDQIINPETGLAQLDNENVANNLSLEFDLATDKLMYTPADLGVGWNGEAFGSGKNAIMLEGNWVAGELDNNYPDIDYGVVQNLNANGKKGSMLFTVGWGINAQSSKKEEAKSFVEFMSRKEVSEEITKRNGTLPARDDVIQELGLDEDPIFGPHVKASEYATVWQAGTTLATVNNEYLNYMPSVVSGKRTIEEALAETQKQANKIIEES